MPSAAVAALPMQHWMGSAPPLRLQDKWNRHLFFAVAEGSDLKVRQAVAAGAVVRTATNAKGQTALEAAVAAQQLGVAFAVLDCEASCCGELTASDLAKLGLAAGTARLDGGQFAGLGVAVEEMAQAGGRRGVPLAWTKDKLVDPLRMLGPMLIQHVSPALDWIRPPSSAELRQVLPLPLSPHFLLPMSSLSTAAASRCRRKPTWPSCRKQSLSRRQSARRPSNAHAGSRRYSPRRRQPGTRAPPRRGQRLTRSAGGKRRWRRHRERRRRRQRRPSLASRMCRYTPCILREGVSLGFSVPRCARMAQEYM